MISYSSRHDFRRATTGSAGYDIPADLSLTGVTSSVVIYPNTQAVIPTGLYLNIPTGFYGQIYSRSGLALRHGIIAIAGVIDSDYRGEVKVGLYNLGGDNYTIRDGDRIAQILFLPIYVGEVLSVRRKEIETKTERGGNGFGSTGI